MTEGTTTDMTGGLYRRIYAGFLTGKRINAVSVEAEAWFWRLHAIADDFGNLPADPRITKAFGAPLRDWSVKKVESMTKELQKQGLVTQYSSDGEPYHHIDGFEIRQPAGKNGRRIQRYPIHPNSAWGNPGESKIIQSDSRGVSATDTDTDTRSDTDTDTKDKDNTDTDSKPHAKMTGAGDSVYKVKPDTAPDRGDRPFVQVFILKVAEAFRWTSATAMSQKKSVSAIARKLINHPDRDAVAADFIQWAREKADDPALEKPIAAWQAEVTRVLDAHDARKDY